MKKKVVVISLGGSLIIPDKIDTKFLTKFKRIILSNTKNYKFVIVCGGGSIARKYIKSLEELKANTHLQSLAGIGSTRMNARFMSYFFNKEQEEGIPHKIKQVKRKLKKEDIIFCGALEYKPNQTTDATAAGISKYFKTDLINLTNVKGLYDKNPKQFKNAKFISKISWKDFDKMANKSKFTPGQHFVLDQSASEIIKENKITTYIIGKNLEQLKNLLKDKKFTGTKIGD